MRERKNDKPIEGDGRAPLDPARKDVSSLPQRPERPSCGDRPTESLSSESQDAVVLRRLRELGYI